MSSHAANDDSGPETVRVWDPLVRVLHWTLVMAFFGAFALDAPRALHETLGYIALGAVAVRVVWGFIGSTHARFSDFVPRPSTFIGYVRDTVRGQAPRYLGHNPAGGAMVVALLAMVALLGVTGWMMTLDGFGRSDWLGELHEGAANAALALVVLHVLGVTWASARHGENLVAAMFTGLKER